MNQTTTPQPSSAPTQQPSGAPGRGRPQQQGRRPRPKSRYGTQMAEKQNLKGIFGIRETQLRKYYQEARRVRSATGAYLVMSLERRLDNAVFRAGFAATRPAARQMVSHGFFSVNGHSTTVASYSLRPGDVITIKPGKRGKSHFASFPKSLQNVQVPAWLLLDAEAFSFKVTALPTMEEANVPVDIQAIVEFFAR